jgi:gentisate 1,2-dioxygenase
MFVVPSWEALDHQADATADIFEVSDEATMRALHLFRDETVEQHQEITGVFEPRRVDTA